MSAVDDVIDLFQQKRRSLPCSEATRELQRLGFRVRDGRRGGHKVISHPDLKEFRGASFNGGHGSDDELKPADVGNLVKMLKLHKDELEKVLGASP